MKTNSCNNRRYFPPSVQCVFACYSNLRNHLCDFPHLRACRRIKRISASYLTSIPPQIGINLITF